MTEIEKDVRDYERRLRQRLQEAYPNPLPEMKEWLAKQIRRYTLNYQMERMEASKSVAPLSRILNGRYQEIQQPVHTFAEF